MLNQIKRKTIKRFCLRAYLGEKRARRERGRSSKKTPEELRREHNGGARVRSKRRKSGEKETGENESGEKNGGARPGRRAEETGLKKGRKNLKKEERTGG
ncbi:hypothetical protein L484_017401 [Morus notabilis]|uniref:Uncharacterized protein n=1 Tax=Morus notabilis TaxID=981085 RepID=W9R4V9_9ROSA|nr:hypothetical protein L484_017401 [Morus notabilis]